MKTEIQYWKGNYMKSLMHEYFDLFSIENYFINRASVPSFISNFYKDYTIELHILW